VLSYELLASRSGGGLRGGLGAFSLYRLGANRAATLLQGMFGSGGAVFSLRRLFSLISRFSGKAGMPSTEFGHGRLGGAIGIGKGIESRGEKERQIAAASII